MPDTSALAIRCIGALAALSPGDSLQVRVGPKRWEILDCNGLVVGQLAAGFNALDGMRCIHAKVFAIVAWDRERSEPQYQDGLACDDWEVVVPGVGIRAGFVIASARPRAEIFTFS